MQKPTDIGMNRTGIATSPIDSPELIRAAESAGTGHLDGAKLRAERATYARHANPLGTVPPPASVKGIAKTVLEKLEGHKPTVFIDKLGERLAFERTGVRLYEALLAKLEGADPHPGGPTSAELEVIRTQELGHAITLRDAIAYVGADPTAMTPSADVMGVASAGWIQVLSDPRTTLNQCMGVMLAAETADVEGWLVLVELANSLGFDDLAKKFAAANEHEEEHARKMRSWVMASVIGEAGA